MPTQIVLPQVPHFNFVRSRATANRMIMRWGRQAILRSSIGAADVPITVVIIDYSPQEWVGRVYDALQRKAIVSPLGRDGFIINRPDPDTQRLITYAANQWGKPISPLKEDAAFSIIEQPSRIDMDGTVIYWELRVRR